VAAMSYERRPSKAVTRMILIDLMRRLAPLGAPAEYRYVGFGALEFIDFDLVHRIVGINDMISIEADESKVARYDWNRPFNGVIIMPGRSSTVLSTIDWSRRSIVWLDYTSQLTSEVISDSQTLARVLVPGSVLAVTLNAYPVKLAEGRREALVRNITAERVPIRVTDEKLGGWGLAEVQYEVLSAALAAAFGTRGDAAKFRQLLNVWYKDSSQMQLMAGVVDGPDISELLDQCRFGDVPETRTGREALHVRVPLLTSRERAWANQRLPLAAGDGPLELPGVSPKDLQDYADVYRRLAAAG
jgi:hypothetical protein